MSLLEIRKKFVELSGRYDLVVNTTDWADNGADWFINAGQKFLDRMIDSGKTRARCIKTLSTGEYFLSLDNCRAISDAKVQSTDGSDPVDLTKDADLLELDYTDVESGKPAAFHPAINKLSPDTASGFDAAILRGASDTASDNYNKGILVDRPADKDYVIEVYGLFYSNPLTVDADKSYWSEEHPTTLVLACLYKLESFYRNTSGANDYLNSLTADVIGIDMDEVAEEIAKISQIGD